ncbi:MAG: glycosyltransferase [Halieaceae bacterium]|nr:glycosyltransferase [Halieaceae bacterium]
MIDIVIPVYRHFALTRACLESVLATVDPDLSQIYVINDASPEPAVAELCRSVSENDHVTLIEHAENRGFVKSVNAGMRAAHPNDVVILNSDTEVPQNWLARIITCAERHPRAASLTPFSNNGTVCSYPTLCEDNDLPEALDLAKVDALVAQANTGAAIEIPTGVGFCMYLRRAALEEVGNFDEAAFGRGYGEENDWCLRATKKGWQHFLCADLFVYHAGGASFGEDASAHQTNALSVISARYPDYNHIIAKFIEQDPIEPARHAIDLLRPDEAVVIAEYRRRERNERAARYALDNARHTQVQSLDQLLHETRESSQAEAEQFRANIASMQSAFADAEVQYNAQIASMQSAFADAEAQYNAQIAVMADGYSELEAEYARFNQQWFVRASRWFARLWSHS